MSDLRLVRLAQTVLAAESSTLSDECFWSSLIEPIAVSWMGGSCEKDYLALQNPAEFGGFMSWLVGSGLKPRTFCEVGVWKGGVFTAVSAYLHRLGPCHCVALDTHPDEFRSFREVKAVLPNVVQFKGTANEQQSKRYDLVHIDGDHSFRWVTSDFQAIGQFAKTVFFHDVGNEKYTGASTLWKRVRHRSDFYAEWCRHPMGGIGVMVNPSLRKLYL